MSMIYNVAFEFCQSCNLVNAAKPNIIQNCWQNISHHCYLRKKKDFQSLKPLENFKQLCWIVLIFISINLPTQHSTFKGRQISNHTLLQRTRGGWAVPSSASKAQAFWVQWSYFFWFELLMVVLLNCWIVGLLNCWFVELLNG